MNNTDCLYLGLDTSAYTTSMALVDGEEEVVLEKRLALPVKEGSLGLRQSEAVYCHLQNIIGTLKENDIVPGGSTLAAAAVSTKPRPIENSYMPVFNVGYALGLMLSRTAGVKLYTSTHQEGHIMSGLWSQGLQRGRYLVLHLSGGTTEVISAEEYEPGSFKVDLLGYSSDLNAGQFVDRIGVAMGLPFPSGPELEQLALRVKPETLDDIILPVAVKDNCVSFSGPASHAERLLAKGCLRAGLARAVEICIADSMAELVLNLKLDIRNFDGLLAVGGVLANALIRDRLAGKLNKLNIYYAAPQFSSDNAVGLAVQAKRRSTV